MIVSTSLIRRRASVSGAEFRAHWLDPHGPLTARIPGTRRYLQNHVVDGPATNDAARSLGIDGFAQLAFATPESRRAAHGSPELKACDQDSRSFIGAVARVISRERGTPPRDTQGWLKQILLCTGASETATDLPSVVGRLTGIDAVLYHDVLEQGGAPDSPVPDIGVRVRAMCELWLRDRIAAAANATRLTVAAPALALFHVDVHVFL